MTAPPARDDSTLTPLILAASQWVVGVSLALVLALLFLAISALQLSSESVGERLLRRNVAVSTNIDAILPGLEAALREEAGEGDSETVRVPDFPIAVDLPRDEALSLEGAALRERILHEAADALYEDGTSAWAGADDVGKQDIETISIAGAIDRGLGLITEDNHDRILIATIVLGFFSAVLAAALVLSLRSWGRLIALSAATVGAALPLLASAVGLRFAFRTGQEEADPFVSGLLELGVEAMWVPIRNYLALTALSLAVLLLMLVMVWVNSRQAAGSVDTPPA